MHLHIQQHVNAYMYLLESRKVLCVKRTTLAACSVLGIHLSCLFRLAINQLAGLVCLVCICRYAELKRNQLEEELAQCTFSPKINESSKHLAQSARRPQTARGRSTLKESPQLASKVCLSRLC